MIRKLTSAILHALSPGHGLYFPPIIHVTIPSIAGCIIAFTQSSRMYSSYYTPRDGRESTILTDHEALRRDVVTHKSIQSEETQLRPLDLETIMSSKAALKYWYLHRPKTMEYVHKNAAKMQSLGRAFAVRQLIKKYGVAYTVELAKADAKKKHEEFMAELSDEERRKAEEHYAAYTERVAEARRQRKLIQDREKKEEEERIARQALEMEEFMTDMEKKRQEEMRIRELEQQERDEKEAAQKEEEEALRREREETLLREENAKELEENRKMEEEIELMRIRLEKALEQEELERLRQEEEERKVGELELIRLEEQRQEELERVRQEELLKQEELERIRQVEELQEMERAREEQEEMQRRALEMQRELEEHERHLEEERIARRKADILKANEAKRLAQEEAKEKAQQDRIQEKKEKTYQQSFSVDVPVLLSNYGPGRVIQFDKEQSMYHIRLSNTSEKREIIVPFDAVKLDEDRILSPRVKVDTPFGVGEVIGLDPHVGCYAINTEIDVPGQVPVVAFVNVRDVAVFAEEVEERAIVDTSLPIPDEIGLVHASIVDSRVVSKTGAKFIQYKLEVKTSNYGTVYCWKRYSTFRSLCDRLRKESGFKKKDIPELPSRHIIGNFSNHTIGDRRQKLNQFLMAAVEAEHLQWGIKVDDQIAVYKRRVKKSGNRRH